MSNTDTSEKINANEKLEKSRHNGNYRVLDTISPERQEIIDRINQYEKEGRFFEDVENDPPSRELMPDEIDYLKRSLWKDTKAGLSILFAKIYLSGLIRKKQFVIRDYKGIENFRNLHSGAIITCNHFHALDSFAIHMTYFQSHHKRRRFLRVIKEGNYTSFKGFYGYLMRNADTLPLSSNMQTMKKFMRGVNVLLKNGNFILVYPEQSMWWNYRKPKPFKKGAFTFAVHANVPVLPVFITMEDTDVLDDGGYPVQAYTVHVCPPIYPDPNLSKNENINKLMEENFEAWKKIYEETYGKKLEY